MAPIDSFTPKATTVSFPWPAELTGLERIILSAQGDLQRLLSAFFAHPITVETVFARTHLPGANNTAYPSPPTTEDMDNASITNPITQTRQVHLKRANKIVCTATSIVSINSPRCAHLFLEEKYAIGQMFRKLQTPPQFELLEVGLGAPRDTDASAHLEKPTTQQLWRRYKLSIPEFQCEILEVFPSRNMFAHVEEWLNEAVVFESSQPSVPPEAELDRFRAPIWPVQALGA
ncbi:hypothetical protein PTI98_007385 [Pleurotus ostreatus]|nr:hypothetical protein PTI98_007385 [Pleurotus ostreatus]